MSNLKRDPDLTHAEPFRTELDHPAATADATFWVCKVPTGKNLLVTRTVYANFTGLTADNTNAFAGLLKNGSVVVATAFNTDGNDTVPGATLVANTPVEGTLAAALADRWVAGGSSLTFLCDEDGDSTLPAGRLVVEGYLY